MLTSPTTDVLQIKTSHERLLLPNQFSYFDTLKKWEHHYRDRVNSILSEAKSFSLPITPEPFESYFSGFEFTYIPFDNSAQPKLDGCWDRNEGQIRIFYSSNAPEVRQRFTITHELIHVYQAFDPEFLAEMEAIKSPQQREQLMERIANKTAAYYLAPLPLLAAEAKTTPHILSLAAMFGVSTQAMEICLKDYGIVIDEKAYKPPW
ncbi:MAG: hypothetical protein A3C02_04470 [Candidatus Andersenbacteria bacterium RIFCSPHIGHO2_02_FULL_45_11]|uniref:IrrE N-terminal-like domain-containing protein n=1 Tax=Candidatus Andersenbacteria bacterium RIFCSPHIGHO2_12_FULL_45_11 TaxID=1797281 RepID=A0A1G1X2R5_9BACT|nr:MAG: hypothetical protein A2805_02830 [Candidatus Andersenbacteria bacterium RIFCSPHIGHO2_01_FULL_46_36]OGY32164.1 MAG: hypothetical protein A3C02_04470 [Candidatus Andersenbacteria bacterium RIFCSPHIGHO2_02_FULL_45_11]OGY34312.1 MAG: hypothetical protein A3D99_04570 [Candidatus Andersenbacteria bacterium RIFCSPHIGHO2_12_FULL_45_11]